MPRKHIGTCLEHSRVIDSRFRPHLGCTYRWRICTKCNRKFATHEVEFDEISRLRAIEDRETEIRELADHIYQTFGPKPDAPAAAAIAETPGRNASVNERAPEPQTAYRTAKAAAGGAR